MKLRLVRNEKDELMVTAQEYDPKIPPGFTSRKAYLLSEFGGANIRSPFLDLLDFPGGVDLMNKLEEGGEIELEFDVLGESYVS